MENLETRGSKPEKRSKILISTGIYPPKIGGPAQYTKNLKIALEKSGKTVVVKTFDIEDKLPTGIRHLYFFLKIIPTLIFSEGAFIFDTYSVGFPTVLACKIFRKKSMIRTGGDFLWEQYVERTGKKVLFSTFYDTERNNFNSKEKVIFKVTHWTLRYTSHVIFSTKWQKDIFVKAYDMDSTKTSIVENFYGPKTDIADVPENSSQVFVGSARHLVWKNFDVLNRVFAEIQKKHTGVELFTDNLPFPEFMEKMKNCYAVILISLGDISPNMILDAIRNNKPFICTKEVGIYERIKDAGIFVDPQNEEEITNAITNMLDPEEYKIAQEKVRHFNFVHTWDEIAKEFMLVLNSL